MSHSEDSSFDQARFLQRWTVLARQLQLPENGVKTGLWLLDHYAERNRHYHGVCHILTLLDHFEWLQEEIRQPLAVQLAIFFHDAIYDVSRSDNEARSAGELRKALGGKIDEAVVAAACAMIEATRSHTATGDPDTDLLIDMDMAILSEDWPLYVGYARDVMREYVPVHGEEAYQQGRVELFLKPTLARGQVFLTSFFIPETNRALANMRREIELLERRASLEEEEDRAWEERSSR